MTDPVFETLERLPAYRIAELTIRRPDPRRDPLPERSYLPNTTSPISSVSPARRCVRPCGASSLPG